MKISTDYIVQLRLNKLLDRSFLILTQRRLVVDEGMFEFLGEQNLPFNFGGLLHDLLLNYSVNDYGLKRSVKVVLL